jgi:hypothetical protein
MHCLQALFLLCISPEEHDNTNLAKDPTNRSPESSARPSRTNKMSQRAGAACNRPMMLRWQSQWELGPTFCACQEGDGLQLQGKAEPTENAYSAVPRNWLGDAMQMSQLSLSESRSLVRIVGLSTVPHVHICYR